MPPVQRSTLILAAIVCRQYNILNAEVVMTVSRYLESKYGAAPNAEVSTEFLCDELLVIREETKRLVKSTLH